MCRCCCHHCSACSCRLSANLPVPFLLLAPAAYARLAPSTGPSYDIAMLALATPSVAATVALTSGSIPLIDGETVWAAGFGVTETGESSDILR